MPVRLSFEMLNMEEIDQALRDLTNKITRWQEALPRIALLAKGADVQVSGSQGASGQQDNRLPLMSKYRQKKRQASDAKPVRDMSRPLGKAIPLSGIRKAAVSRPLSMRFGLDAKSIPEAFPLPCRISGTRSRTRSEFSGEEAAALCEAMTAEAKSLAQNLGFAIGNRPGG